MKPFLTLSALWLLFASCATVITRRSYPLLVQSPTPGTQIVFKDSIYTLPAFLRVTRSKSPLSVRLLADTVQRDLTIKAAPNPAFLFGNLAWMQAAPVAYLVDFTNPKRFYYGRKLLLQPEDTQTTIRPKLVRGYHRFIARQYPVNKGDIRLHLSLPYVNHFLLHPAGEETRINTGCFGLSGGLDYAHRQQQYLRLTAAVATDYFLPIPAASVDWAGPREQLRTIYLSLSNNHSIRRFSLGYGLAYARNTWDYRYYNRDNTPPPRDNVKKTSQSLGLLGAAYFRTGRHFQFGVLYRPTFVALDKGTAAPYEHLISLDFDWMFCLRRN